MAKRGNLGLDRRARGGDTWYLRRAVPKDVRWARSSDFFRSTGTTDYEDAKRVRLVIWAEWDREIAKWRTLGPLGETVSVAQVLAAIERWCRHACAYALAGPNVRKLLQPPLRDIDDPVRLPEPFEHGHSIFLETLADVGRMARVMEGREPFESAEQLQTRRYFELNPKASRALYEPPEITALISALERASVGVDEWRSVNGFEARLDEAIAAGGLTIMPAEPVRRLVRMPFALAWAEVERHRELERMRAACFATAARLSVAQGGDVGTLTAGASTAPQVLTTIEEGIENLRLREEALGHTAAEWKHYGSAYRALVQLLGAERRLTSVSSKDAAEVVTTLRSYPSNATKFWPGLSIRDAVKAGEKIGAETIAPNTVANYVDKISKVWKAADLPNPFKGLRGDGGARVLRRGFTTEELRLIFDRLVVERGDHPYYWVAALALFHGGRQNEFAQLRTSDVKTYREIDYFDFSEFDAESGERADDKSLKTATSTRVVPIHPALIEVGFLDLVERRRRDGAERIFPELKWRSAGGYSTDLSRWFAALLDRLELKSRALVFHSFRHGWIDAAREADVPERIQDVLGGWAAKGQAAKYGNLQALPVNLRHLSKVGYEGFVLPSVQTGAMEGGHGGKRQHRVAGARPDGAVARA